MGCVSGQIKLHPSSKKLSALLFFFNHILKENTSPMTQATQLPFPSFSEDEKIELPKEPRLLFIRVSLDLAQHQDKELRRLVNSNDPADARQAMAILQTEANGVPERSLSTNAGAAQTRATGCSTPKLIPMLSAIRKKTFTSAPFFAPPSSKSLAKLKCTTWSYTYSA